DAARPIEQGVRADGLKTSHAAQEHARVKGADSDAEVSVRGGHAALCRGNVGTAFESFTGQGRRNAGDIVRERGGGQMKIDGRLTAQDGKSVQHAGAFKVEGGQFRLGAAQLRFGL